MDFLLVTLGICLSIIAITFTLLIVTIFIKGVIEVAKDRSFFKKEDNNVIR